MKTVLSILTALAGGRLPNGNSLPVRLGPAAPHAKFDIVYLFNSTSADDFDPAAWKEINPISSAFKDVHINGSGSADPYDADPGVGFALHQFRDSEGHPIPPGEDFGGNYPWIDRDARNLLFTGVRDSLYNPGFAMPVPARSGPVDAPRFSAMHPGSGHAPVIRTATEKSANMRGLSVVGLWTRGKVVHVDTLNNDQDYSLDSSVTGGDRLPQHRYVKWYRGTPLSAIPEERGEVLMGYSRHNFVHGSGWDEVNWKWDPTGPRVQNSSCSDKWRIPTHGYVVDSTGGPTLKGRIETVAMGGVNGRGLWLDGDAGLAFDIEAGPRPFDDEDWYFGVFLDSRFGTRSGVLRRLLTFPDGSTVDIFDRLQLQIRDAHGNLSHRITLPADRFVPGTPQLSSLVPNKGWCHLAFERTAGTGSSTSQTDTPTGRTKRSRPRSSTRARIPQTSMRASSTSKATERFTRSLSPTLGRISNGGEKPFSSQKGPSSMTP